MPRKPPNRGRPRPGRRPPNRFRIPSKQPQPSGFNAFGMRTAYDICLPGVRGPARKALFNALSAVALALVAFGGAWLGIGLFGPLGAFPGLLIGLAGGGQYLADAGYYRR